MQVSKNNNNILFLYKKSGKEKTFQKKQPKNLRIILVKILIDKTMANKLIYNPNDDKQNYSFCRFKLVVETF